MFKLDVKVNTRDFDRAFAEYKKNCSREISEAVVTKAYYIARNAVNTTSTADGEKIKAELLTHSQVNPDAPLAAILVNTKRGKDGKKGLQGEAMKTAMEKFIRARERSKNWLRSGWIAAIKEIEPYVKSKGSAPNYDKKVKVKGAPKGGAKVGSLQSWRPFAKIWNSVYGNKKPGSEAKVTPILEEGLQKAVDKETASMIQYIEKKLQKAHDTFNHS
jgi:hypothetical protein